MSSAKSPLMSVFATGPLVVTRRLTDAPLTVPMLESTQPPLGEPVAETPAKEKLVTSPQKTGEGGGEMEDMEVLPPLAPGMPARYVKRGTA